MNNSYSAMIVVSLIRLTSNRKVTNRGFPTKVLRQIRQAYLPIIELEPLT